MARKLEFPKGSYVVFDRGYTDYAWIKEFCEEGIRFVTRLKCNTVTIPDPKHRGRKSPGYLQDQQVQLKGVSDPYARLCIWMQRPISPTSF